MATTKLGDVYPIIIDKYESFVPLNGGVDMIEKINSVVEHLNRLGQLTTETVNQWNKVMKWVNADGLTDSVNAKIDDLISKGMFDELLNGMFNDITTSLTDKTTKVYVENFKLQSPETDDTLRIQRAIDYAHSNGFTTVEFASKIYNTSAPIKVYGHMRLLGNHKVDTQIISQGDIPTIASEGYFSVGIGSSSIIIESMGIYSRGSTTKTKYAIEMVNTFNCIIRDCYINELDLSTSDVGGVRFSKDSTYTNNHFVNAVRNCQLQSASIVMESTDSYICDNEIWSDKRSFAIHLVKSSQFVSRNQIVGSVVHGGVWVEDTKDNYDIEIIRIVDNYFDGSYSYIDTGIGVNSVKMRLSRISNNDFWYLKDEGIKLTSCHSNSVTSNQFENNNRRDASKDDIYLSSCASCTVVGNTFKRDVVHTNKGSAIRTVNSSNDKNIITSNTVYFTSFYNTSSFSNVDTVKHNGGISDRTTALRVYLANNTGATVGAETKLAFDTVEYDLLSNFNTTNNAFTAPVNGIYQVSATIAFNAQTAGNRTILVIYKNGVFYEYIYDGNSNNANSSASGSTSVKLNAGDTLTARYYSSGNAGIVGGSLNTHLKIVKIVDL